MIELGEKMDKDLKMIIRDAVIIWGLFFTIGLLSGEKLGILGFTVGSFTAIMNFIYLMRNTRTAIRSGQKAGTVVIKGYMIRYLFMCGALLLSVQFGMNSLVSCAIGLFIIRFSIVERQIVKHLGGSIKKWNG